MIIPRERLISIIDKTLERYPVVLLIGPRQCGKTTIALEIRQRKKGSYFDLEDPDTPLQAEVAKITLKDLRGLVIIDEFQYQPELFSLLRVLTDRKPMNTQFLILGSASPDLVKGVSETLAGRVAYIDMGPFSLLEISENSAEQLWLRGGFPESYLKKDNEDSFNWRSNFIRSFLERDRIHVPFGDVKTEGVVLRGASTGNGYDLIEPDEMLGEFLRRRVKLHNNADLNSISITRTMNNKVEYINIKPENLFKVILKAGDTIDILWEKGVMVNGFVLRPGGFKFFPGYVAADYVNMAGGNSPNGSPGRCKVLHKDGTIEYGQEILIRRGDVIIVPRTYKDVILGSMSSLEIVVSLATIYLTFIATQN